MTFGWLFLSPNAPSHHPGDLFIDRFFFNFLQVFVERSQMETSLLQKTSPSGHGEPVGEASACLREAASAKAGVNLYWDEPPCTFLYLIVQEEKSGSDFLESFVKNLHGLI